MYLQTTPIEDIATELETMQGYLDEEVEDDIQLCAKRLEKLCNYISRAGKLVSDARYYLNQAKEIAILKVVSEHAGMSPSTVNALITAGCRNENLVYDRADKIYKTIEKQSDNLRTIISKAKAEILNIQR